MDTSAAESSDSEGRAMRGSMKGAVRGGAVLNLLIVGAGRVGAEPLYRLTVRGTLGGTFSQGCAVTASG